MKLATYKDGSRDGQLVVVSRDLALAHYATGVATRLQQVLDDWNFLAPLLQDLYETLNHGKARHAFAFDPQMCMAPLPRGFGLVQGTAYPNHVERLAAAGLVAAPQDLRTSPRLHGLACDALLGPTDDVGFGAPAPGMSCEDGSAARVPDFAAGLAVVVGDIDAGATPSQALEGVRLLTVVNHWRELVSAGPDGGPGGGAESGAEGPFQACPTWGEAAQPGGWTACAPVAVTPDELGSGWQQGKVRARLQVTVNGQPWAALDTAAGMHFHFGQLLACVARQRPVRAGVMLAAGPISDASAPSAASWLESWAMGRARPQAHAAATASAAPAAPLPAGESTSEGESAAAAMGAPVPKRGRVARGRPAAEAADAAVQDVSPLREGDVVRIELVAPDGMSLCGAIEQAWVPV